MKRRKYTAKFLETKSDQELSIDFDCDNFDQAMANVDIQKHELSKINKTSWIVLSVIDNTFSKN